MGRPSTYTPELAAEICERLAAGESLRAICGNEKFPDERTVRRWVIEDVGGFSPHYARARDMGLDAMADECLAIADNTHEGTVTTAKEWGEEVKTGDMLEHRKLRVEARKWYLSKLAPKKYGDRIEVEHSGDIGIAERLARGRNRVSAPEDDGSDLAG